MEHAHYTTSLATPHRLHHPDEKQPYESTAFVHEIITPFQSAAKDRLNQGADANWRRIQERTTDVFCSVICAMENA